MVRLLKIDGVFWPRGEPSWDSFDFIDPTGTKQGYKPLQDWTKDEINALPKERIINMGSAISKITGRTTTMASQCRDYQENVENESERNRNGRGKDVWFHVTL